MYHSFLFESSTPLILVNSQSQPDYVNEAELGTTTYSDFCSECKICKTRIGERGKKQWKHNELKHGKNCNFGRTQSFITYLKD